MSTPALIIFKNETENLTCLYKHFDGYPERLKNTLELTLEITKKEKLYKNNFKIPEMDNFSVFFLYNLFKYEEKNNTLGYLSDYHIINIDKNESDFDKLREMYGVVYIYLIEQVDEKFSIVIKEV